MSNNSNANNYYTVQLNEVSRSKPGSAAGVSSAAAGVSSAAAGVSSAGAASAGAASAGAASAYNCVISYTKCSTI